MKRTWLIQRLDPPKGYVNPFSTAGLGLNDRALALVNSVWDIYYMGAAEYEFGSLPKCLSRMVQASIPKDGLHIFTMVVKGSDVKRKWDAKPDAKITNKKVYVISTDKKDEAEIREVIKNLAKGNVQLKERTAFDVMMQREVLADCYDESCGWIDIENDFMFFLSKEMYQNTLRVILGTEKKK